MTSISNQNNKKAKEAACLGIIHTLLWLLIYSASAHTHICANTNNHSYTCIHTQRHPTYTMRFTHAKVCQYMCQHNKQHINISIHPHAGLLARSTPKTMHPTQQHIQIIPSPNTIALHTLLPWPNPKTHTHHHQ